jgi:hypothetical protein
MLKPFVLKAISIPEKVLFASLKATGVSMSISGVVFLYDFNLLLGFFTFLMLQLLMIYLTYRDYYFMETLVAYFRCIKTQNYYPVKGNLYDA